MLKNFLSVGYSGFTLAEVLISLAILGTIATFTIPKILISSQNQQKSALAKEVAAMVASAYDTYRQSNMVTGSTTLGALTPYMNYVALDTSSPVDDHLNRNVAYTCGAGVTCLKMHGGGIFFYTANSFSGTSNLHSVFFFYDPDGQRTGINGDDPGKAICFVLYYDGRLTTRGTVTTGTLNSTLTSNPGAFDPSWFSWQ